LHRSYVKIKCANGKYLKIDKDHGDKLIANGVDQKDGDLFEYAQIEDSTSVFRAANCKYACAEYYYN
jgi:hypothetical protein